MPIKYEKYISLILELFTFLKLNSTEKFRDYSQKSFLNSVIKFFFSLLKTYPEFLSYYYLPLINALGPYSFNQLKNIILSATPNDIDQPDPYVSDFKVISLFN
jgi:CCR4-NOT transcription complex subunit 1